MSLCHCHDIRLFIKNVSFITKYYIIINSNSQDLKNSQQCIIPETVRWRRNKKASKCASMHPHFFQNPISSMCCQTVTLTVYISFL